MAHSHLFPALLVVAMCLTVVTAQCPSKPGYVAKEDTNWVRGDDTTESQTSPDNAAQVCDLDDNCLAFNNFGYYILKPAEAEPTLADAGIKLQPYDTMCTYVKESALPPGCPDKPGYVTKEDTNWVRSDKTRESQTRPDNAAQICSLDSNCMAFNSFGYYILKNGNVAPTIAATGVKLQPYDTMCTYIKESALAAGCPDKPGYVTKEDTNWVRSDKTRESQTRPDNAAKICSLDSNCMAFNNFGYYILKNGNVAPTIAATGVKLQPYDEMCTYIKESALAPAPSSVALAAKTVVFRNVATKLCFTINENQRLLLGLPRLLQAPCSASDRAQAFKVVPAGGGFSKILDFKGRCVTLYSGLLVDSAGVMACGPNRADQLWSLVSQSPNGKGPYSIKSKENSCLINLGRSVSLTSACNPRDNNELFEAAAL